MATNIISVLNDLTEMSKDSERDFRKAAEITHDQQLKPLFTSRANDCSHDARELQDMVQHLGGRPHSHGTLMGALHRSWLEMKTAVVGRNDRAILFEREKGEDIAQKHYREALNAELPADVRVVVERQYQGVTQNHARMRELREQYMAARA